jgi:hypothetical protein
MTAIGSNELPSEASLDNGSVGRRGWSRSPIWTGVVWTTPVTKTSVQIRTKRGGSPRTLSGCLSYCGTSDDTQTRSQEAFNEKYDADWRRYENLDQQVG